MTDASTNNPKFIPAGAAAKRVGYSLDYVSRLAREGKILAERQGRQWHVDVDSLKLFSLKAKADQQERQEILRQERKNDLVLLQKKILEEKEKLEVKSISTIALGKTAVLTLSFAILLTLTWNVYDARLDMRALSIGAFDIGIFFKSVFISNEENKIDGSSNQFEVSGLSGEVDDNSQSQLQRQLIIFNDETDTTAVSKSFSDEVEVEFLENGSGVIRPRFVDDDSEYRFLLAPLNQEVE